MPNLENVADRFASDPMFARDESEQLITRDRICECGKPYTQRQLSRRFMQIVERHSPSAAALTRQQIPELFVPVHCPKCERVDIGRQARIDEGRYLARDPQ